jgi:glycosyltransferase involved in cell wall biosynthesis
LDLPPFFTRLKKAGILPVPLYYLIWQLAARMAVGGRLHEFDLVHHVTFNGFRFPGAWWHCPIPVVLGPLGGGSIANPAYRRCFGNRWFMEWLRGLSVRAWRCNPWTTASLLSADAVVAVGSEMADRFKKLGITAHLMLETAVPAALEVEPMDTPGHLKKDFLLVGNLEPWKAWQIAFESFAGALGHGMIGHRLVVVGSGRQLSDAKSLAKRIGIEDHVMFSGQLPREDLWKLLSTARALIFPSIRDTSGNAALEAMALACPVVCFRHQGVAWITDNECAIRIEPGVWETSVEGFAKAIRQLADNDSMVETMGQKGRTRSITRFSWKTKIDEIERIYRRVTQCSEDPGPNSFPNN